MSRKPQQGPLQGIRILDLSRLLPGPLATQMMADLGAEVIKIEDPKAPDYTRFFPPQKGSQSIFYLSINRSKKSVTLDLKSEEGKRQFFELVKTADIVVDSFRPGVLQKMGIDYESAKQHNEKIIYVAVTGYGYNGPYMQKAGHDLNYIGYAGILGLTGDEEKPVIPACQTADVAGGSYPAIVACLSALWARERTGKGQFVDVAMT
ncbi:MAG TPA: CaiB/BaiF CoA-transferase family protein, partial [Chitinophagales bacterium]|nr:CaiB/BaiF CoA-transferase family protein [Chitinophagales bacterium]